MPTKDYGRATNDCIQDSFENAPFASVGGLDFRDRMIQPKYIKDEEWEDYQLGYQDQAYRMYGSEWRTIKFGWYPALEIKNEPITKENSGKIRS